MNRTLSLLLVAFILVAPVLAFAQAPANSGSGQTGTPVNSGSGQTAPPTTLMNPLKGVDCSGGNQCVMSFLMSILELFIQVGSVVLVVMVIYIGFLFIVAQGAPESLTKAKNMLLWTLIGGLILLGAQGIAKGIQATVTALGG